MSEIEAIARGHLAAANARRLAIWELAAEVERLEEKEARGETVGDVVYERGVTHYLGFGKLNAARYQLDRFREIEAEEGNTP